MWDGHGPHKLCLASCIDMSYTQTCKYILNFGKDIISYIMAKKVIDSIHSIPKFQKIYIYILLADQWIFALSCLEMARTSH